MAEDDDEKMLELKSGGQVEARLGRANYRSLSGILQNEPELFRSLLAVARDETVEIPKPHAVELKNALFLKKDGTIAPDIRDVLLSAYRDTPDGPALVNPFRYTSEDEVRQEDQAEKAALDRIRRLLRDGDNPGAGGTHGRG